MTVRYLLSLGTKPMEHRWYPRHDIDLPAKLVTTVGSRPVPCRIQDYSMGGFYLASNIPLRRHQLIAVHPQRVHDSPWVIYGLVIHVQEDGAGIEAADPYWPKQVPFSEWLAMTQHRPAALDCGNWNS